VKNVKNTQWNGLRIAAWAMVCGAGLAGCGGDGGDAPVPETTGTVALTAANRDTAARVTATSVIGLGVSTAIPLGADGRAVALQAAPQAALQADLPAPAGAARIGMASWLPARVLDAMALAAGSQAKATRSGLRRPLAVVVSPAEPCASGGTITFTLNDSDNNGQLNAGDSMSFAFNRCQDSPAEILDGSVAATFTQVGSGALPTFGARMVFSQLSQEAVNGRHGLTLDGAALLDYEQVNDSDEHIKLTIDGSMVAAVQTHLPFSDTVTLRAGFYQDTRYDGRAGLSTTTMGGSVQSKALGGTVVVSTLTPIQVSDSDNYPRSGVVKAVGSTGEVRLTAVSVSQVRIELDADQNGSFESGVTQTWDWLI
jgi:hypothetical protein